MVPYFKQGLELGRSFVQPKYWGKRSLDYLWFGIGAFLQRYPNYHSLFGPV
ncbi:MAG: putative hemolysin [Paraglaciecola sp.]|jgi:putative hemolysin